MRVCVCVRAYKYACACACACVCSVRVCLRAVCVRMNVCAYETSCVYSATLTPCSLRSLLGKFVT